MLHINDITFRIDGKPIFESATAGIPTGHKVGLVGRNGAGKTTLLRLVTGELALDGGSISTAKAARIGIVAQEAPGGPESLVEWVLQADLERAALLAEAETASDGHRIAEIHQRLADIDAHAAPARAATILSGLGFDEAAQARPCGSFSGGWRMRVALAAALFASPEVLLLDEPTNYLDLEGALWLETFIARYPHTVLIVSHDRDLLNKAVGSILHLDRGKLTLYSGGYDDFERQRRERQRLDLKLKAKQDDQRRHMEAFVERFRAKATKARQAQSRLKALERMQPIAEVIERRVAPFIFPSPAKKLGDPLLRLEGASVGYGEGPPVLAGLSLRIDEDDRIGLLGANGNGKSTFAKLISGRLEPREGLRRCSKKLTFGYFAQHQLDELDPAGSPYTHIAALMPEATEAQKRAKLGALGFGADKADTKCAHLSGGEKARLLFAIATFEGPHILILDEPTNHLDVDSREALVMALNEYEGAVILISHDRHLIEATADRLWVVRDGSVRPYDGDIESYRMECLAERGGRGRRGGQNSGAAARAGGDGDPRGSELRSGDRRTSALRRADLAPLRKEIAGHERRMEDLSSKIARLDAALSDVDLYQREPDKVARYAQKRAELARDLEETEAAWLEASELLESGGGK
ncbi:MAG: ATP-binding cassette domain-containing protein [Rhizobiales bacterium]|nr:ATP-binding cassette domain-containing protein [Hyphomicrobiales bacterium]